MKVQLDSRLIVPGDHFVPVKGENHDGHGFIEDAFKRGAIGVLEEEELYIKVREILEAQNIKLVGITGSNGKTTTTHLAFQLLSYKHKVALGKQNTKLGLAADFINHVNADTEVFVAEIGMDRLGEIQETVNLFPLDVAVITTINSTHLEKLKTLENITKAKFEIAAGLKDENSVLILNRDNLVSFEYVQKHLDSFKNQKLLWFGEDSDTEVNPQNTNLEGLNLLGRHNLTNVLAVIAVAKSIGMSKDEIQEALPSLSLPRGRLNVIAGMNGSVLIDDSYNANPVSTINALDVLNEYSKENNLPKKVAILGNMLELGKEEYSGHLAVAEKVDEIEVNTLVTVGDLAKIINEKAQVEHKYHLRDSRDLPEILEEIDLENAVVLIKGSQGPRMERITEVLMQDKDKAAELLVRQDKRWKDPV